MTGDVNVCIERSGPAAVSGDSRGVRADAQRCLRRLVILSIGVLLWGCSSGITPEVREGEGPRQERDPLTPPLKMNARWIAGQLLRSELNLNGDLGAQQQYASGTWARAGVVRYEMGPQFLAQDLACGVDVGSVTLEFPVDSLTGFDVFPDLDERRDSLISQEAIQFRIQYQGGNTPVVGVFPWLGRYDLLGVLRREPDARGSTPGVLDTRSQGVIILAYNAIRNFGYPTTLTHEMVHLLTGRAHEGPAFIAWESFLTIFSGSSATNKPVWNGRSGSEAGIEYRNWDATLLTLASVKDGSFVYDQCAEGRASPWLQPQ